MRGQVLDPQYMVQPPSQAGLSLQNSYCARAALNNTEVLARQGVMVAYRGNVGIEHKSQGAGKWLKRAVTGEGLALMSCAGQGEVWFADTAEHAFILTLDPGDALSISGQHVLCFENTLQYDINMIKGAGMFGGGLFNCTFQGQGSLAFNADGQPMVLPVTPQLPVLVDTDAVVGWTAQLQTQIHRSQGMKSMLKGGSGEMFQIMFQGQGFVIVQPSEGLPLPQNSGGGGGGLFS